MELKKELSRFLDLANHHADSKAADIEELCEKVLKHGFNAAFVNPYFVPLAREKMGERGRVGTVVSFPLGQDSRESKVNAAVSIIRLGADEIDVSANVGLIKSSDWETYLWELKEVVGAVRSVRPDAIVKFILETGFLSPEEIKTASKLVLESGADFVKTCSGMGPRGATVEDVRLIREAIGDKIKVKVAGGITTYSEAVSFIEAGADRIGTSHAVEILLGGEGSTTGSEKRDAE